MLGDPCASAVGRVSKHAKCSSGYGTSRTDVLEMHLRRYFQLHVSPSYTSHVVRAKPRTRRSPRLEPRPCDRAERVRTHSACTDVRRGTCDHGGPCACSQHSRGPHAHTK
eukprot:6156402-Prymnesium_polylepis.1